MKCVNCGNELSANAKFCTSCGTPVKQEPVAAPVVEPVIPPVAEPIAPPVQPVAAPVRPVTPPPVRPVTPPPVQHVAPQPVVMNAAPALPRQNRPLGAWAYFGLQILFSIPLVGFICLIVFSLDDSNINRRNFARSYWCGLIIGLVLTIALLVLLLATGIGAELLYKIENLM